MCRPNEVINQSFPGIAHCDIAGLESCALLQQKLEYPLTDPKISTLLKLCRGLTEGPSSTTSSPSRSATSPPRTCQLGGPRASIITATSAEALSRQQRFELVEQPG